MRLETLCNMQMRYLRGSWHRPYTQGEAAAGEGIGFGQGEAALGGEIEGTTVWANFPRRRQEGVGTGGQFQLDETWIRSCSSANSVAPARVFTASLP